jgi:hypothetical protein
MKKYTLLLLALMVAIAFSSCKKSPQYIYVDNMSDEAKVSFIEGEDDNDAYSKAFENYSNARFYPVFSEFEKTRKYIAENDSASEACEGIEGEMAPPDDSGGGGEVISTSDDASSLDGMGDRPVYMELSKFNTPTFTLFKITDSSAREAAQDYIDKKITYEEFVKLTQGKVEEVNLYDKNFDSCVAIDRKVFDQLQSKLAQALDKIDKDAANKKGDAVE